MPVPLAGENPSSDPTGDASGTEAASLSVLLKGDASPPPPFGTEVACDGRRRLLDRVRRLGGTAGAGTVAIAGAYSGTGEVSETSDAPMRAGAAWGAASEPDECALRTSGDLPAVKGGGGRARHASAITRCHTAAPSSKTAAIAAGHIHTPSAFASFCGPARMPRRCTGAVPTAISSSHVSTSSCGGRGGWGDGEGGEWVGEGGTGLLAHCCVVPEAAGRGRVNHEHLRPWPVEKGRGRGASRGSARRHADAHTGLAQADGTWAVPCSTHPTHCPAGTLTHTPSPPRTHHPRGGSRTGPRRLGSATPQ